MRWHIFHYYIRIKNIHGVGGIILKKNSQRMWRLAFWLIENHSEVIVQEFIFKKPKRQKPGDAPSVGNQMEYLLAFGLLAF